MQNTFFNCCLAAPRPTLDHYQGDSLTNIILSPARCLVGLEPGTFRFWLERLNTLGHFLHLIKTDPKIITVLHSESSNTLLEDQLQ